MNNGHLLAGRYRPKFTARDGGYTARLFRVPHYLAVEVYDPQGWYLDTYHYPPTHSASTADHYGRDAIRLAKRDHAAHVAA